MRGPSALFITLAVSALVTAAAALLCRKIHGAGGDGQQVKTALARQLVYAFDGTSFLVEAEGTCPDKDRGMLLEPPAFLPVKAAAGMSVLERVRLAIDSQQGITVRELSKGILLIRWPTVSNDLFRTKIGKLSLGNDDQFNPSLALEKMFGANEVRVAMRRSGHRPYPRVGVLMLNQPQSGTPHLPAMLSNESVEGVLSQTLQTFGGVIIYAECSPWFRTGHNDIDYYPSRSHW